jgi:RNA polymerase sigma factor (sigma-70 family)
MGSVTAFHDGAGRDIIEELLEGGTNRRRAEDQLFSTYSYFIREGIIKYSLSEDESFDAYSDSILSAIDKIISRKFEGRSTLKTWLFQIFHNKCVDLLRKKTTHKRSVFNTLSITDVLYNLSDSAKLIIQKLMEESDWDFLHKKLNEIGEQCHKLLQYWAEGYPDKEIAALLEYKTADVVKTSRLRCLERLRQLYKKTKE